MKRSAARVSNKNARTRTGRGHTTSKNQEKIVHGGWAGLKTTNKGELFVYLCLIVFVGRTEFIRFEERLPLSSFWVLSVVPRFPFFLGIRCF